MKQKIVLLSIIGISLFGCNGHKVPSYKRTHYDSVLVTIRNGNGYWTVPSAWWTGGVKKMVRDTVGVVYSDAAKTDSLYVHVNDSFYFIPIMLKWDTVFDAAHKPKLDSATKKPLLKEHDTVSLVPSIYVSEVDRKLYPDTTKY